MTLSEATIAHAAAPTAHDLSLVEHLKQPARLASLNNAQALSKALSQAGICFIENIDNVVLLNTLVAHTDMFFDCAHLQAWCHRLKHACQNDDEKQKRTLAMWFVFYNIKALTHLYANQRLTIPCVPGQCLVHPYSLQHVFDIRCAQNTLWHLDMPETAPHNCDTWLVEALQQCKSCCFTKKARTFTDVENTLIELTDVTIFPELALHKMADDPFKDLSFTTAQEELNTALTCLKGVSPRLYHEVQHYCHTIVPLYATPKKWKSRTVPEVLYAEAITFHPLADMMLFVEQLAHETAHTKLELIRYVDPLIEDDGRVIYNHPWRPEKRPITAVLVATHAFLAVSCWYSDAFQKGIQVDESELKKTLKKLMVCMQTLDTHAAFTSMGKVFYLHMVQTLQQLMKFHLSIDPPAQVVDCKLATGTHYQRPFSHALLSLKSDQTETFVKLRHHLQTTDMWHLGETSFYAQWELQYLAGSKTTQKYLPKTLLRDIHQLFETVYQRPFCRFLSLGAHKMEAGHRIGIHNDAPRNAGESHRMVIMLNAQWDDDMGGHFAFFDSEHKKDIRCAVSPHFGNIITFECANLSHHAVSTIKKGARLTFLVYAWQAHSTHPQEYIQGVLEEEGDQILFLDD